MLSVLLVDDEPALLEMLVQIAQRSQDIRILPVKSAKEALKILSEQSFDVIITDYAMPEMDGIALIARIRDNNDMTPVILFSDVPGGDHSNGCTQQRCELFPQERPGSPKAVPRDN